MSDRSRILLGTVALVAIVFVSYAPSLEGEFIWDDDANVSENPTIRTAKGLRYIWTRPEANQQYYPLTHTSFWVEYQLWELWPAGFRITNLLLHALVATLIWRTLRRLAVPGAWVAAAVFALHPVHVESVAWITERKNLLSACFYFAALLAWLHFAGLDGDDAPPRRRRLAYAGSLILFTCALLSKTAVLTLPAAILVLAWWRRGRLRRADVISTLPMFALGAVFGAVTLWLEREHVGAAGPAWDLSLAERILVGGRALWFYAAKLVLPTGLNFIYPRWTVDAASIWQWLFPAAAVALPVWLWRQRERFGRGDLAGVLIFWVTLAPALGLLDFYFQLYAFVQDHFQYLASAGLIALLVGRAATLLRRWHPRAGLVTVAVLLLGLGGMTFRRSFHFTSEEALWTSTIERNPEAWMAEINLGLLYHEQERFDEAETHLRRALETVHPEHGKARFNLAVLLEARGDYEGAREQYELALALEPRHADAHNNLGNLLAEEFRTDEAMAHYRAAIEANPDHARARYNLALRLSEQGSLFEAERQLREAIRVSPGYLDALDALGRILGPQGRSEEAAELYRLVLALDPARFEVHYNLGLILERLEDRAGAERHYREAIRLAPDLAGAHNNLAIVLYHTERYAEAWRELARYRALGGEPHPGFVAALSEAHPPPADLP